MLKERSNFKWFHKTIIVEAEETEEDFEATNITNDINQMSSGAAASGAGGRRPPRALARAGGSPGGVRGCGAPARESGRAWFLFVPKVVNPFEATKVTTVCD